MTLERMLRVGISIDHIVEKVDGARKKGKSGEHRQGPPHRDGLQKVARRDERDKYQGAPDPGARPHGCPKRAKRSRRPIRLQARFHQQMLARPYQHLKSSLLNTVSYMV